MRDILFRGKQMINGEWGYSEYPFGTIASGIVIFDFYPDTVGQYTGLTDKNGTKIFEGDILSVTVNEMEKEDDVVLNELIAIGIYTGTDKMRIHKTPTGNKLKTVWTVEHKEHFNQGVGFYVYGKDRRFHLKLSKSTLLNVNAEVIGNIHDNPELLESEVDTE